jgi:hypothetical protein
MNLKGLKIFVEISEKLAPVLQCVARERITFTHQSE